MLLGLIQWLQSELKKIKKSSQTLHVPVVPRGFKFIHKVKESRVHQSAVGPSLVA
jgi:hypothetical protein